MDPLAAVATLLAHGGLGGLLVEIAAALAIVALGFAFWVGNRGKIEDDDE